MTIPNHTKLLLLGSAAFALSACGGSSTSSPVTTTTTPPVAAAPAPGVVKGPISGFGSVIVNGSHYNTNGATFNIDGQPGSQADLKVGQIVRMKTLTNEDGEKTASSVSFKDAVQGPIDSISFTPKRIVVLGQNVVISGSTSFDEDIMPGSIEGLNVGDIVQVSGQFNGSGNIVASQIELKDVTEGLELTGHVSGLDTTAMTFKIRGLDVDYSGALMEEFGEAEIANGNLVEVKGTEFTAGGALIATSVNLEENEDDGDDGDDAEVKGFITEFTDSTMFSVGEQAVITDGDTVFEYCEAGFLALDVEVEVEGEINADGVLVADKVECEFDAIIQIESTLDAVDATTGLITIFGVEFASDMSTRFQDKLDTPVVEFDVADLVVGDFLDVKGFDRTGDGDLYAAKIEREAAEDEHEVQAFVDSVDGTTKTLVLLGITILTDAETEYEGIDDTVMTEADFFAAVMSGELVKAEGTKTEAGELLAREISLENPDD
jgi:hypothetical protein